MGKIKNNNKQKIINRRHSLKVNHKYNKILIFLNTFTRIIKIVERFEFIIFIVIQNCINTNIIKSKRRLNAKRKYILHNMKGSKYIKGRCISMINYMLPKQLMFLALNHVIYIFFIYFSVS